MDGITTQAIIGIVTVILMLLVIGLFVAARLCKVVFAKTDWERERDDEEQMEYLRQRESRKGVKGTMWE